MPPQPFSAIDPKVYLFGLAAGKPEEEVRQWVLFELLSTYGIPIHDLEVERPVRVGTRNHRADIVVLLHGKPLVVIECKRQEDADIKKGMEQARSYANSDTIRSRYAVYTNGRVWKVNFKVADRWVPVPDIPRRTNGLQSISLHNLIACIMTVAPLLHWIGKPVPAKAAERYLAALQRFFSPCNMLTANITQDLLIGADNLLRVASTDAKEVGYRQGKMTIASRHLQKYLASVDAEFITMDVETSMLRLVQNARIDLRQHLEEGDVGGADDYAMRVLVKIVEYVEGQLHGKPFVAIPASTTAEVDRMLAFLFSATFGLVDPNTLDEMEKGDIERLCEPEWKKVRDADILSWKETFSLLASYGKQKVMGAREWAPGTF